MTLVRCAATRTGTTYHFDFGSAFGLLLFYFSLLQLMPQLMFVISQGKQSEETFQWIDSQFMILFYGALQSWTLIFHSLLLNRFTEELFATLVAFIFIFNAFKSLIDIGMDYKFSPASLGISCQCLSSEQSPDSLKNVSKQDCLRMNATLVIFLKSDWGIVAILTELNYKKYLSV